MSNRKLLRSAGYGLSVALLFSASATGASAWENPLEKRYTTGPLDLCDQGTFHVGGVPKITSYADTNEIGVPQQVIIGHMYVEFQIPKKRRQWPVIMVHGGGYSGSCLSSTPHATEGWDSYAVRNNLATFIVDQAGRGRSTFDSSPLIEAMATNNVSLIPTILRNTSADDVWTNWLGHLIPPGSSVLDGLLIKHGDPGDPMCAADPAHCTYNPKIDFTVIDPKIEARVGAIGPAPNPANHTQLALEMYKFQGHLAGENFLPTSDCPTCNPSTVPPDRTWSGQDLAELVTGLGGAIVATHSQSGAVGHHMVRYLKEMGQLDKLKGLITIEGNCSLEAAGLTASDFDNIPYLAFKGDYSDLQPTCEATVAAIQARRAAGQGTAAADSIKLDDPSYGGKFNGVTHMMMQGTDNLEVFGEILKWTTANIDNPIVQNSCPSGPPDVPPGLSKKPGGLPPGQAKKS